MAQELQRVFPTAVFKNENGYLSIRWDELFYSTVNAIKELDKKIVALVKRTVKVETQISKLEKENVELKNQIESLTARVNKLKAQ
jgi:phage shock protein A